MRRHQREGAEGGSSPSDYRRCSIRRSGIRLDYLGSRICWLLFKRRRNRETLASAAADYFADAARHRSHALRIDREQARRLRIVVDDLEADQDLQDAVLSVHLRKRLAYVPQLTYGAATPGASR